MAYPFDGVSNISTQTYMSSGREIYRCGMDGESVGYQLAGGVNCSFNVFCTIDPRYNIRVNINVIYNLFVVIISEF